MTTTRARAARYVVGFSAVVAWMVASSGASAYPISPRPLWDLVEESELVVVATVDDERDASKEEARRFASKVAVLKVRETLKGDAVTRVEVAYEPHMVCPAPPRYETGLTVLAFLQRNKKGFFTTTALSYGTLYPELDEMPVFAAFIKEATHVQNLPAGPAREAARIDWLVRAASDPVTRWHGLYGLARDTDARHAYYDSRPAVRVALTGAQREQLAGALVKRPALDPTFPMFLSLLIDHPSKAVDEVAVAAVDTLLEHEHPPMFLAELMDATLARLHLTLPAMPAMPEGPAKPAMPAKPDRETDRNKTDEDAALEKAMTKAMTEDPLLRAFLEDTARDHAHRRAFWTKVRATLPFPRRTLELPRNRGVPRTGGMTPL